jgi:hypothetical protein
VNAPWIFSGCWKIIQPWIDPYVSHKIKFIDPAQLPEYIDPVYIPTEVPRTACALCSTQAHTRLQLGGGDTYDYEHKPIAEGAPAIAVAACTDTHCRLQAHTSLNPTVSRRTKTLMHS